MDDDEQQLSALREKLKYAGRGREPAKMAELVSQLLARRGYLQTLASDELHQAWTAAVGAELAAQTRPGNIRGGVLQVFTVDSPLIQELTLRKRELIKRLRTLLPDQNIRDLRFRAGDIR